MGFQYQDLKERGDSIELERRESFTTERSHNGYIKRKKTIVRERFQHPNAKELRNYHKRPQQTPQSEVLTTQRQGTAESGRTTTETFGYHIPGSRTLLSHCRDKSHLERAVNRTSVQLKRLAHEIDNEIAKLKRERDKLMLRPRPHPLMRNAAIQNDLEKCNDDDEAKIATTANVNLKKFNAIADNIEFTIEKFSSQHKFVCTSPRYARDEQTSCRPRMRTIGLQKDTQRNNTSSVFCDSLQNLKAKLGTALQNSPTNLANLKAKGLLDPAPPNCYAFDYGGTGDGQNNALKIYHLENCRCAGGCNPNGDCNCQKVCERYNTVNNYNGMLCNKNTYVEKGVTPCSEYKYCRDEYHYDYPRQNSPCRPCIPCLPYQPSQQPCQPYVVPCLPPCPIYQESQPPPSKPKMQVIYGRRMSDLNTDEFYHPTGGSSPTKHTPTKHAGSARRSNTKERVTVDVPKDGRTSVDIERHGGRAQSKSRRKHEDEDTTKQRGSKPYEPGAVDKTNAKRQLRERTSRRKSESSGSADSSEKLRRMKNKEKLLEITFTKERRRRASSGSGDEGIPSEQQKPSREYTREAKRSMKQMTITAYKPCKPTESEGDSEGAQKRRKKRKSEDRKSADDKSEDDKTWDERLRREEQQQPRVELPREDEEVWIREGIPTITEFYNNYRIGDAWEAGESNVAQQQQYVGAYRGESFQASPRRSYDIMPVQKDTVRDIPPAPRSPVRGRRLSREGPRDANQEDIIRRSQVANGIRSTTESSQMRTGSYGFGDNARPIGESTENRDYESRRAYAPADRSRLGVATVAEGKSYSPRDYDVGYKNDKRYMADRPSRGEDRESIPRSKTVYARDAKPRSARDYDNSQADKKYKDESALRADYERSSKTTPATLYASDTKPHSARDSRPSAVYAPDEKPRSARGYDHSAAPKSDKRYVGESSWRAGYEPSSIPTSGSIYAQDEKLRSTQDYVPSGESKSDKKFISDSPSGADRKAGIVNGYDSVYTTNGKSRSALESTTGIGIKTEKRHIADSPLGKDHVPRVMTPHDTAQFSDGKQRSARNPNIGESHSLHEKPQRSITAHTGETLHSPRDYDSGVQSIAARSHDANSTSYENTEHTPGAIHSQDKRQQESPRGQEPKVTPTPSGQESLHRVRRDLTSSSRYDGSLTTDAMQSSEKLQDAEFSAVTKQTSQGTVKPSRDHLQRDLSKGALAGYASKEKTPADYIQEKDGKPKIKEGYAEKMKKEPSGEHKVSGKTDASGADVHRREEEKSNLASPQISGVKSEKSYIAAAGPSAGAVSRNANSPLNSARTGKDLDYHGPDVPEIHIEDNDESARSGKRGREESARIGLPERAKFAFKGEMVLEPQYSLDGPAQTEDRTKQGGIAGGESVIYRNPDTTGGTGKTDMTKSGEMESTEGFRRRDEAADADGRLQLSPFPSLESPRIYMRPRTTCPDYGTACSPPPTSDCPKKYSPRVSCVENAGDVYMCEPESYNACQPTSACPCVSPNRSCNEIPYEKLGDQYTHSPVRQLAANSHLAVALQPDAATGNYIPSPQPKISKNCIYLRSTGTQYSATIIENHEDRCAPQYIPLPKDCSQMSLEVQKEPPPSPCCTESCHAPCEDFQTVSCTPQNNYKFLCEEEEEIEVYEDKTNLNNDKWCQRVEITNSEKNRIFIGQQQAKENSPRLDCKKYFLPWQQDQKFIPGQPMSDCDVQYAQIQQRPRYQSLAERRMPRFNATMPPHQEMPEEEAKCAEELPQYKPQPRVKFMEQNLRQCESRDASCYPQGGESNYQAESMEAMPADGSSERPGFNDCREFQQIPKFTGCPCMFKTYLNMITLYYPDCRTQMPNDDGVDEEDCSSNGDDE